MNEVFYTVQVGDCDRKFREGTTYLDIAKEYQHEYEHDIVLVFVDGRLQELFKTLKKDCKLEFVTTADSLGYKAYRRSMSLMLVKAVYDVAEHKNIDKVRIHYSVSKGYYCTIEGNIELTQEFLDKVERRMRTMVEKNLPIQKKSVHTDDAIAMFGEHGMHDKERLFHYRRVSRVNIYSMNEFEDYYYGYMVPSAGYLKYFKLYLYDEGFVIQMPTQGEPEKVPPFEPQNQLFHVLQESTKWGDAQGIETVGDLNDKITRSDVNELVLVQEALQEEKIAQIAEQVRVRSDVRFVLIAGPSSSSKTTFSHRLSVQLRANGLCPYPIAVDNYFKEREETPKDENGNYDFEGLGAVDVELFNRQLQELLDGKEVRKGLSVLRPEYIILFKAKAYLDLQKRKDLGEKVDSSDIKKHKKDILRIASELMLEKVEELPTAVDADIHSFIDLLEQEPFDQNSLKRYGLKNEDIVELLKQVFG